MQFERQRFFHFFKNFIQLFRYLIIKQFLGLGGWVCLVYGRLVFRLKSCFSLHCRRIFFKFGCRSRTVGHRSNDLTKRFFANITCRVNAVNVCFLCLVRQNISVFVRRNSVRDKFRGRFISDKHKHPERIVFARKSRFFSRFIIFINNFVRIFAAIDADNFRVRHHCYFRILLCFFRNSRCAGKIVFANKHRNVFCVPCQKNAFFRRRKAAADNKDFLSRKKFSVACRAICNAVSFEFLLSRKTERSRACAGCNQNPE